MNTRIIGLTFPGSDNPHITLERFGRRVQVPLSEDVVTTLRTVCHHSLPIVSSQTTGSIEVDGFKVETSPYFLVGVSLTPEMGFVLSKVLANFMVEECVSISEDERTQLKVMGSLIEKSAKIAKEDWESNS
jgi:hypothetical protein